MPETNPKPAPPATFRDGTPITKETVAALEENSKPSPASPRAFGDPLPDLKGVSKEALEAELAKRRK